jgi:hypothetical protein
VEVRKPSHRPAVFTIVSEAGKDKTVSLEAPEAIYGSLDIKGNVEADLFIDGENRGTTPIILNRILVGSHSMELRATGYQPHQQTVEIQEGKITTLQPALQKAAPMPTPTKASTHTISGCVASNINLGKVGFLSDKTWTFGDQTWSAPVTATYCEKTAFDGGGTSNNSKADCRKHSKAKYGHLFSWCMVATYAAQLCPSPWRVPTKSDFERLAQNVNSRKLSKSWGYGGYAISSFMRDVNSYAYYWSSTEYDNDSAYFLVYYSSYVYPQYYYATKANGRQVRCVK